MLGMMKMEVGASLEKSLLAACRFHREGQSELAGEDSEFMKVRFAELRKTEFVHQRAEPSAILGFSSVMSVLVGKAGRGKCAFGSWKLVNPPNKLAQNERK